MGRTMSTLEETCALVSKFGGKAIAIKCDIRNLDEIETAVAQTAAKFGGLQMMAE